jgi:hypothetical protein
VLRCLLNYKYDVVFAYGLGAVNWLLHWLLPAAVACLLYCIFNIVVAATMHDNTFHHSIYKLSHYSVVAACFDD